MERMILPYEISIWQDVVGSTGITERKIGVIGSHEITNHSGAVEPIFTPNINGSYSLSFSLYRQYFDPIAGEIVDNPFLPYMVNERKVKLFYQDQWYDFIIDKIVESSDQKKFEYTATSLAVKELSKNGYAIEFNSEMLDNMQTAPDAVAKVLDGTNWSLDLENSDKIIQYRTDHLYEVVLSSNLNATNMRTDETLTIASGEKIYVFYSSWNGDGAKVQILWANEEYTHDDDLVINNAKNYLVARESLSGYDLSTVCTLRGSFLTNRVNSTYDELTGRVVNKYHKTSDDKLYYGFEDVEYVTPTMVSNLIANGENFTSTDGWLAGENTSIEFNHNFNETALLTDLRYISCLKLDFNDSNPSVIKNIGPYSNRAWFRRDGEKSGINKGDKYVFDIISVGNEWARFGSISLKLGNDLIINFGRPSIDTQVETIVSEQFGTLYHYRLISSARTSVSYAQVLAARAENFNIQFASTGATEIKIVRAWMYQGFPKDDTHDIDSSNVITPDSYGEPKIVYLSKYYEANKYHDADSIEYDTVDSSYTPIELTGDDRYEKVRSIQASKSNRFNILNNICDTFECWLDYHIEHDETGAALSKTIRIKDYIGYENLVGFKYGVNLKSIKRTVDSAAITTKLIVPANSNAVANNGFCSISRSDNNISKNGYILNFNYYTRQGLLNAQQVDADLLEFESTARSLNDQYNLISEEYNKLQSAYYQFEAQKEVASKAIDAATIEINKRIETLEQETQRPFDELRNSSSTWSVETAKSKMIREVLNLQAESNMYSSMLGAVESTLASYNEKKEDCARRLDEWVEQKKVLEDQFFKKYGNYIREGTWQSEEYYDDDLYYYDAVDVSNTSSKPQVSYDINVISIGAIPGYEDFRFNCGDVTFVEDTEYFGYKADGITPYHESVIVSEVKFNLTQPDKDTLKVKNYKNQFDEFFHRVSATVQSLSYAKGGYDRASTSFNSDGTISQAILQQTLSNSNLTLVPTLSSSLTIDNNGLWNRNPTDPSQILLYNDGVLKSSDDGGDTWNTMITPQGVNAAMLNTGTLNAGTVNITSGQNSAFNWNDKGLHAYGYPVNTTARSARSNSDQLNDPHTYVRMDRFGLYGIKNKQDVNWVPEAVGEIEQQDEALFGLTWDGFFLKGKGGKVKIDSENGINMYNTSGTNVFSADKDGNLTIIGNITATSGDFNGTLHVGKNGDTYNFIVDSNGKLTATSADISGTIKASSLEITNDNALGSTLTDTIKGLIKAEKIIANSIIVYNDDTESESNILFKAEKDSHSVQIANFIAKKNALYNGQTSYAGGGDGVYLGTDGIGLGNGNFYVTSAGRLYSNTGTIGGWQIDSTGLSSTRVGMYNGDSYVKASLVASGNSPVRFYAGSANPTDSKFIVLDDGSLYASAANISGNITATGLTIGNAAAANAIISAINNTGSTTINGGKITTQSITADQIASGTITGDQIATNTIKAVNIDTTGLTADSITVYEDDAKTKLLFNADKAAKQVQIANFTVKNNAIYNGQTSYSSGGNGVYVGSDGIGLGGGAFYVTKAGQLYSNTGTIGGWTIGSTGLSSQDVGMYSGTASYHDSSATTDYIRFYAGGNLVNGANSTLPFAVTKSGKLYATGATISGNITAETGEIGGWKAGNNHLYSEVSNRRTGMYSGVSSEYLIGSSVHDGAQSYIRFYAGAPKVGSGYDIKNSSLLILEDGSFYMDAIGLKIEYENNKAKTTMTNGLISEWNVDADNIYKSGVGMYAGIATITRSGYEVADPSKPGFSKESLRFGKQHDDQGDFDVYSSVRFYAGAPISNDTGKPVPNEAKYMVLADGSLYAEDASITGSVKATSFEAINGGSFGDTQQWVFGNVTDPDTEVGKTYATLTANGNGLLKLGDWMMLNSHIHTFANGNSKTYTDTDASTGSSVTRYYDFGMNVPTGGADQSGDEYGAGDRFLYVRSSKNSNRPEEPSDWNYLFSVDRKGNVVIDGDLTVRGQSSLDVSEISSATIIAIVNGTYTSA